MNETQFQQSAVIFLSELFKDIAEKKIDIHTYWDIDHLCYRSDTETRYSFLKEEFSSFMDLLIESEVNGRLISTYKLNNPIWFKHWRIDLVELPAPKNGKVTKEGFEHIEIVCDVPFSDLIKKYDHLELDVKGLSKDFNQELEVVLGERNIKFHQLSLASVIELEKNPRIYNALKESKILSLFKENTPLVVGTYPLGLALAHSDLDIVMCSNNLEQIEVKLKNLYGTASEFLIEKNHLDGREALFCRFKFSDVPFEIVVQDKKTTDQIAFRHFNVEERLLKIKGETFKNDVLKLRGQGLKTEPAFAKALNIEANPYHELLVLQKKPIFDLN